MAKIFLGLAILFMLLSAVLGFLTKTKISDVRTELKTATDARDAANQQATKAAGSLKTAEAKVETMQTQMTTNGKSIADAQAALDAANKDKDDLTKQTADMKTQIDALNLKLSQAPQVSATSAPVGPDPATLAKLDDLQKRVAENDQINKKLAQQNTELTAKLEDYNKAAKVSQGQARARALTGQVLAVQPSWNFVIVSIGDRQGVTMSQPLIVRRGSTQVAKLKVTSVEPATSVADIISSSVPPGMRVEPGDRVLYAAP